MLRPPQRFASNEGPSSSYDGYGSAPGPALLDTTQLLNQTDLGAAGASLSSFLGSHGAGDRDPPPEEVLGVEEALWLLLDCGRLFVLSAVLGLAVGMASAAVVR